ncbi:hypothetical protein BM526_16170 [Alteromonas mediterranea]|uniref:glycosyltransferase n=1 Tax=Alteromonas mediterranea TaxID=314275 RepID=UPI0009043E5C|nr:glycosyltransferase [Alteromonas mediterranea]APE03255.1 hypothetical protein BM526_16170 [Alteromonas mediterranea]
MRVVFYYPSMIIGGAELLFYRTACELHKLGMNIAYVDYHDGYIAKKLNDENSGIDTISIDKEPRKSLESQDVVILPANFARVLDTLDFCSANCRLLFWVIHPENLVPKLPSQIPLPEKSLSYRLLSFFLLRTERKNITSLLNICDEYNGIYYMDGACYRQHKSVLGNINSPKILPLFVPSKGIISAKFNRSSVSGKKLRVAWLGRIDKSFKHFILERLIRDLNELGLYETLELCIIGQGDGIEYIKKVVAECTEVDVRFVSHVEPNLLQDYLFQNVDLLCAMGTSALEGAKAGIPVVCLDASYQPVDFEYKYRLIYQGEGLSLGYIINQNWFPDENKLSIKEILLHVRENFRLHAQKSLKFYQEGYEPSNVIKELKKAVEATNLKPTCFPGKLFRKSLFVRIWRAFR